MEYQSNVPVGIQVIRVGAVYALQLESNSSHPLLEPGDDVLVVDGGPEVTVLVESGDSSASVERVEAQPANGSPGVTFTASGGVFTGEFPVPVEREWQWNVEITVELEGGQAHFRLDPRLIVRKSYR